MLAPKLAVSFSKIICIYLLSGIVINVNVSRRRFYGLLFLVLLPKLMNKIQNHAVHTWLRVLGSTSIALDLLMLAFCSVSNSLWV